MSDPAKRVHCAEDGETAATFVCVHLVDGVACGFHIDDSEPNDQWPDAWCDKCQAAFDKYGGWNETNEPKISLMCTFCYERARAKNLGIAEHLLPAKVSTTSAEFQTLADECCERSKVRQDLAIARWRFTENKRWSYDAECSVISFSDSRDGPQVMADVRIVGSFS
ncbi:MAG: DUF6882 domain-containing protein, partial [Polyangiaceae bacterium]